LNVEESCNKGNGVSLFMRLTPFLLWEKSFIHDRGIVVERSNGIDIRAESVRAGADIVMAVENAELFEFTD
jgi:hypothetical protein